MKPIIQLHSGAYFDLSDPRGSELSIADIAHALSMTCRFGGHTDVFYSVAQHCVLASRTVAEEFAYAALMHDAAEALIGDIPSPLKAMLPCYRALEKKVEMAVFDRFNVPFPLPPEVKHADLVMLGTERRDLMQPTTTGGEWSVLKGIEPREREIVPWSPAGAYNRFMNRYEDLTP